MADSSLSIAIEVDQTQLDNALMRLKDSIKQNIDSISAVTGRTNVIPGVVPQSTGGSRPVLFAPGPSISTTAVAWLAQNVATSHRLLTQDVENLHIRMLQTAAMQPISLAAAIPSALANMEIPVSYRIAHATSSLITNAIPMVALSMGVDFLMGKRQGMVGRALRRGFLYEGIFGGFILPSVVETLKAQESGVGGFINRWFLQPLERGRQLLTDVFLGERINLINANQVREVAQNLKAQQLGGALLGIAGIQPAHFSSKLVWGEIAKLFAKELGNTLRNYGDLTSLAGVSAFWLSQRPDIMLKIGQVLRATGATYAASWNDLTEQQQEYLRTVLQEAAKEIRKERESFIDEQMKLEKIRLIYKYGAVKKNGQVTLDPIFFGQIFIETAKKRREYSASQKVEMDYLQKRREEAIFDSYFVAGMLKKSKSFYTVFGESLGFQLVESKRWGRGFISAIRENMKYNFYMTPEELKAAGGKRGIFTSTQQTLAAYAMQDLGGMYIAAYTQGGKEVLEAGGITSLASAYAVALSDPLAQVRYEIDRDRVWRNFGGKGVAAVNRAALLQEWSLWLRLYPRLKELRPQQSFQYFLMHRFGLAPNVARAQAGAILGIGIRKISGSPYRRLEPTIASWIEEELQRQNINTPIYWVKGGWASLLSAAGIEMMRAYAVRGEYEDFKKYVKSRVRGITENQLEQLWRAASNSDSARAFITKIFSNFKTGVAPIVHKASLVYNITPGEIQAIEFMKKIGIDLQTPLERLRSTKLETPQAVVEYERAAADIQRKFTKLVGLTKIYELRGGQIVRKIGTKQEMRLLTQIFGAGAVAFQRAVTGKGDITSAKKLIEFAYNLRRMGFTYKVSEVEDTYEHAERVIVKDLEVAAQAFERAVKSFKTLVREVRR